MSKGLKQPRATAGQRLLAENV